MSTMNNEDAKARRQRLLAARAECLAKMTDDGRRAFEQRQRDGVEALAKAGQRDGEPASNSPLAQETKSLVLEAHRLRQKAKSKGDVRTALRGLDTALRALGLYGRATGEITNTRRVSQPQVDVVATREEGVRTAAELLLALATAKEISDVIPRLERRRMELNSVPLPTATADSNTEGCLSAVPPQTSEPTEIATISDSDKLNFDDLGLLY